MLLRAGAKHLYIPGGSLGVRACSAGEIGGGGVVSTWSVQFSGASNQFINCGDVLNITGTSFSACGWTNVNIASSFCMLVSRRIASSTLQYQFWRQQTTGALTFMFNTSTGYARFDGAANSSTTGWHHIAVVYNGSTVKMYFDGLETDSFNETRAIATVATAQLRFGTDADGNPLTGNLDDVRIYNVALSPTDVANLYAGQDVTTGLVAYWALEEGSGVTAVDSIGGNNGTLTNGPTWHPQPPPQLVPDRITSTAGVVFDGSNDEINISGITFSTEYSVSLWVKTISYKAFGAAFSQWALSNPSTIARANGAGTNWQLYCNSSFSDGSAIPLNAWQHVTVVVNQTNSKLYVNGVLDITVSSGAWASSGSGVQLGVGNLACANIAIDDVRIYSRALSATEVAQLCRGQNPATNDPVGWWKLDEGSGTTAADSGSGGNNGTLTNGPTWIRTNGVQFDGVDDSIVTTKQISQVFSYAAWIKVSKTSVATIVGGTIQFRLNNPTTIDLVQTGTLLLGRVSGLSTMLNQWTHVAVTYDASGNWVIYKDGVSVGSGTQLVTFSNSFVTIGAGGAALSENFEGIIDNVVVYNSVITPADVASIYNGTSPTSPVGWWKLNEQQGTIARDSGSGGNNGTLTNGPTWAGVAPWLRP